MDAKERFRSIYKKALVPNVDKEVKQMEDYARNNTDKQIAQAIPVSSLPVETYEVPLGTMDAPMAGKANTASSAVKKAVKANNDWNENAMNNIASTGPAFAAKLGYDWNELSRGQKAAIIDIMFNMPGPLPEVALDEILTPEQIELKAQGMIANSKARVGKPTDGDEELKKQHETGYKYSSLGMNRNNGKYESEDIPDSVTHMRGELSGRAKPITPKSIEDVNVGNVDTHRLHMGTENDLKQIADKHYNGGSVKPSVSNNVRNNTYKLSPKEQMDYYDFYNGILSRQFTNTNGASFAPKVGKQLYSQLASDRVQRKLAAQRMGGDFAEDTPFTFFPEKKK